MKNIKECTIDELEQIAEPLMNVVNNDSVKESFATKNYIKIGTTAIKNCADECETLFSVLGTPDNELDKAIGISLAIVSVISNKTLLDFFTSSQPIEK